MSASISEVEVKEEPNHEDFIEYPEDQVECPSKKRRSNVSDDSEPDDRPDNTSGDPGSSGSADSGLFENIYEDCNDSGKHLCNICQKKFLTKSNLQEHKKKNHSLTKTEWKCSLVKCKGNFESSDSVRAGPTLITELFYPSSRERVSSTNFT